MDDNQAKRIEPTENKQVSGFERLYGLLLAGVLVLIFFNSGFLKIHHVMVTGNHTVTDEEVLLNARIKENQTLLQTNGEQIRANLLSDPRIAEAQVNLEFPDQVLIRIRERKPFLLVNYSNSRVAVGEDGVVLSELNQENLKLPVVAGIDCPNLKAGTVIMTPEFATARLIVQTVEDRVRQALSEIDLRNYLLLLDFPATNRTITVELGNSDKLEEKLAYLRAILIRTDLNNLAKIDLRTAESPTIIAPTGGGNEIKPKETPAPKP